MLRRSVFSVPTVTSTTTTVAAVAATTDAAIRGIRTSTLTETLKPTAGENQGTMSLRTQVTIQCDKDNEAKWPTYQHDAAPSASTKSHSNLSSLYKWGYNSLSLFIQLNELPGNWAAANDTNFMTDYSTAGDFAASGLHSGIWPFCKGTGMYNTKPARLRSWAFGKKADKKNGGIKINYGSTLDKNKVDKLLFPHTKEHEKHRRVKNPPLTGFTDLKEVSHGKRIMRECQYHLGQGMRQYLIDGYFGSHPGTATSFRIFTDNPDHAYIASMNSIRNKNVTHYNGEHYLQVTGETSPLDEWVWRRPSVLVYHCPSYDFELPRIVEEFGGPRPQDMSLTSPQFQVMEPYSIPMKAMIGAVPNPDTLFDTIGFLASRWGFYADDRRLLTLPYSESVVNSTNDGLTVVVGTKGLDTSALRQSPFLYGSRHHRLGNGIVSRAWDATDFSSSSKNVGKYDLIDEENGNTAHRPLSTRVNSPSTETRAYSHRLEKNRGVTGVSYKFPHTYTDDVQAKAAGAGMLFGGSSSKKKHSVDKTPQSRGRASGFNINSVKFIVVGGNGKGGAEGAAKAIIDGISKNSMGLYAEQELLLEELKQTLANAGGVEMVSQGEAQNMLNKLAKSGSS